MSEGAHKCWLFKEGESSVTTKIPETNYFIHAERDPDDRVINNGRVGQCSIAELINRKRTDLARPRFSGYLAGFCSGCRSSVYVMINDSPVSTLEPRELREERRKMDRALEAARQRFFGI